MSLTHKLAGLGIAALVAAPMAMQTAGSAAGAEVPELITGAAAPAQQARAQALPTKEMVTSRAAIKVNAKALDARTLRINLAGRDVVVDKKSQQQVNSDAAYWTGVVRGTDDTFSAIREGDKVTATVTSNGHLYRIAPLDGAHTVTELDLSKMPEEHPEVMPDGGGKAALDSASKEANAKAKTTTAAAATSTIRALVVATSNAEAANGGSLQSMAQLAVAETNTGYANSGIPIRMELAGYRSSTYREVSFDTDLSRIRGTTDGYMDDVHAARNAVAADVVILLVANTSYCGLGYLNATASTAFTATSTSCATGYYSFGHEVGHNQGANHDPANAGNAGYAHGYQYPAGRWRTIMAYQCATVNCTRINYWSNPNVTYGGVPMGTATQSNNARKLTETAATVAAFR